MKVAANIKVPTIPATLDIHERFDEGVVNTRHSKTKNLAKWLDSHRNLPNGTRITAYVSNSRLHLILDGPLGWKLESQVIG